MCASGSAAAPKHLQRRPRNRPACDTVPGAEGSSVPDPRVKGQPGAGALVIDFDLISPRTRGRIGRILVHRVTLRSTAADRTELIGGTWILEQYAVIPEFVLIIPKVPNDRPRVATGQNQRGWNN